MGNRTPVDIARFNLGDPAWADALVLRRAVLRTPLGLDFSTADIAAESGDTLFAAHLGPRLVGVVMLRRDGADRVKLRQMAVAQDMRGQRVGENLLMAFEVHARDLSVRHVDLAARKTAIGFYERQGYVLDGEEFVEVTIPHHHMSKTLS
jgi:predicted GNAT family N-acyltransferase